jgi:hypothetical protein
MEELTAQVKKELFRTFIWIIIAMSISGAIYFLIW